MNSAPQHVSTTIPLVVSLNLASRDADSFKRRPHKLHDFNTTRHTAGALIGNTKNNTERTVQYKPIFLL